MKIEKFFKSWRQFANLTLVFKRFEIDFMYHPLEWATPYVSMNHSKKVSTWFNLTFLCLSATVTYTYDSFYDNVAEKPEWMKDNG